MPKSVEEKLKSATLRIATLQRELSDAEDVIRAHAAARQWRQSSSIARAWAVTERKIGMAPELGMGYGAIVIDDLYTGLNTGNFVGNAMAEAHRQLDIHARFDETLGKRTVGPVHIIHSHVHNDDMFNTFMDETNAKVVEALAVPSKFLGAGPAGDAEINWGVGQSPVKQRCPKEDLTAYLMSLDPSDLTFDKWKGNGLNIFKAFKGESAGFELFDNWSSGQLVNMKTPYTYSSQRTKLVWRGFQREEEKTDE